MSRHRTSGGAPSQRQLRVGELVRRRLGEILARAEVHDPELNALSITVGEVRTSPDLRVATAYVMPLGGRGADGALEALRRNTGELRRLVARGLALKFAPELRFELDDTFDRIDATRALFARDAVRRDLAGEQDAPEPGQPLGKPPDPGAEASPAGTGDPETGGDEAGGGVSGARGSGRE